MRYVERRLAEIAAEFIGPLPRALKVATGLDPRSPTYMRDYQRLRRATAVGRRGVVATNLKATRGISLDEYERLYTSQRGCCAICHDPIIKGFDPLARGVGRGPKPQGAQLDHDHTCCPGTKSCSRCVRGLLCARCNTGLGAYRDDPSLLRAAARYLERR